MNRMIVFSLVALAALALAPSAQAGWPPCTCDPNPVTDLAKCVADDRYCGDYPEVRQVKQLVEDLDPRNWPCTCDPQPTPA